MSIKGNSENGNILWSNVRDTEHINGPFLCYIVEKQTRQFADWLLDDVYATQDSSLAQQHLLPNKDGIIRFGSIEPSNILWQFSSSKKIKDFVELKKDHQIIEGLEALKDKLLMQENKLYNDLKIKGGNIEDKFKEFKKLWEGQSNRSNLRSEDSIKKYWLNYHLDLMTGETQRLFQRSTKNTFTLIERLLALSTIELEKINVQGDIEKYKSEIKDMLVKGGYLRTVEEYYADKKKDITVYVPEAQYNKGNGGNEKQFVEDLANFFANKFLEKSGNNIAKITADNVGNSLYAALAYSFQTILEKQERGTTSVGNINTYNVELKFGKNAYKTKEEREQAAEQVWKFLETARTYKLSSEEMETWKADNKKYNLGNYIKEQIINLCERFFSDNPNFDFSKQGKYTNAIQGFMGELSAYGKGYFNLKNAQIINVGGLQTTVFGGTDSKSLSGIDLVLRVNNENYGIQVKNPFSTERGFYDTYENEYTLDNNSKNLYNDIFQFSDRERELFQTIDLNVNNTINPSYLYRYIEEFLYIYSNRFARLSTEQIAENEFQKYVSDNVKSLKGSNINNVFFILKGEIFPSSTIVDGLILQYQVLLNEAKNSTKFLGNSSGKNKGLKLQYINNIPKNLVSNKKAGYKYMPEYVHQNNAVEQDLKNTMIKTMLRLEIPSINDIRKLNKR